MNPASPVHLIAVVGGSGAGKSWFVERLCRLLGEKATRLHLDHFYRDQSHLSAGRRARLNFDVPDAIDWEWAERALRDCRAGLPTRVPHYDFATHSRIAERCRVFEPRPVVFVDGLWLLRSPAIRPLFDLSVYLDTPTGLRCSRRLSRDVSERGYDEGSVERALRLNVVPMHARYVEPQKKWADFVLTQPFQEKQLRAFAERMWELLADAALVQPWEHETFRTELFDLLANHEYCT